MSHAQPTTETRVFRSFWQDGSLDLVAGLSAVGIGVGWNLDMVWIGGVIPALAIPIWMLMRQRYVEPRLGHVVFSHERREKIMRSNLLTFALGCLVLIVALGLFWFLRGRTVGVTFIAGVPAALLGLLSIITAFMLGLSRFLSYAAAMFAAGVVIALIDGEPGWAMLAGALVPTIVGLIMYVRFLARFPVVPSEME